MLKVLKTPLKVFYVAGLCLNELKKGSLTHVYSWSSRKAKRGVMSIAVAENLATGEAVHKGKILAETMSDVLGIELELHVSLDS